ncbi:MAG: helix-turn-helix transcriptional regulator [Clostridiales bacterium]|nr:helix-turn-helix transcriptional regulator [Clostridiales bacterium]
MEIYDLGLRLQELRRRKGMSQSQAARRLGISGAAISSYECNIRTPNAEMLVRMALLYNTTIDYIMGLEKRESPRHPISSDERRLAAQLLDIIKETKELLDSEEYQRKK